MMKTDELIEIKDMICMLSEEMNTVLLSVLLLDKNALEYYDNPSTLLKNETLYAVDKSISLVEKFNRLKNKIENL